MSRRLQQSYISNQTNKIPLSSKPSSGIVVDVILDDSHKRIQSKGDATKELYTEKEVDIVGCAIIRPLGDNTSNENSLFEYYPLNPSIIDIPLVGETVEIYKLGSGRYYRRLHSININSGNASKDKNKITYSETEKQKGGGDYSVVSQTGTTNSSAGNDRSTLLGEYFEPQQVNKLKYYEGDSIIQSRYGQSIRFSAFNNEDNKFSPTIILRNRQNDESLDKLKPGDITEEDVNKDGSIIAITSDKYKIPFQPGLIDDGGSTNFQTEPIYAELPDEYVGNDQILINSERLIFSAKSQETLFFSKGNYSIISDGNLSMDFGFGGGKLDFGGDVTLTTDRNSNNVWINTGDGQIRLNTDDSGNSPGTRQKEPLARGETLVKLLSELIDAITQQVFATPAGPTATGPLNVAQFKKIQGQLDKIKSTLNFTE